MCFTFLAALGHTVGDSLLQADQIEACGRLLQSGAPIRLPSRHHRVGAGGAGGAGRSGLAS